MDQYAFIIAAVFFTAGWITRGSFTKWLDKVHPRRDSETTQKKK